MPLLSKVFFLLSHYRLRTWNPLLLTLCFMAALLMLSPFLLMAISFNQVALCTYPAYHVRTLLVVYLPYPALPSVPCPATGLLSDNIFETLITWKVMRVSMIRLINMTIVILEMTFLTRKLKIFIMWDFKRCLPPITACMLSHL